jgi:membrane protease YdiL (CAAX protease family)
MNSVIEESVYRLVFYHLIKKSTDSIHISIAVQAIFYAIPHLFIDLIFGIKAISYGMLLGYIVDENTSIIPCIICHFFIDIGLIGVVMLVY